MQLFDQAPVVFLLIQPAGFRDRRIFRKIQDRVIDDFMYQRVVGRSGIHEKPGQMVIFYLIRKLGIKIMMRVFGVACADLIAYQLRACVIIRHGPFRLEQRRFWFVSTT